MWLKKKFETEMNFNLDVLPVNKKTGEVIMPNDKELEHIVQLFTNNLRYEMRQAICGAVVEMNQPKQKG